MEKAHKSFNFGIIKQIILKISKNKLKLYTKVVDKTEVVFYCEIIERRKGEKRI